MGDDPLRLVALDEKAYRLLKKKAFEDDERMKHIASSIIKKELATKK